MSVSTVRNKANRQTSTCWIQIGHIGLPKGLTGSFVLQLNPLIECQDLSSEIDAKIGSDPDAGIPTKIVSLLIADPKKVEIKLNNFHKRDDVLLFVEKPLWVAKQSLRLQDHHAIHLSELIGRDVICKTTGTRLGKITNLQHYGASPVVTITGDKGNADLPLIADYLDYSALYENNAVYFMKSLDDIEELWQKPSP